MREVGYGGRVREWGEGFRFRVKGRGVCVEGREGRTKNGRREDEEGEARTKADGGEEGEGGMNVG